MRKRDVLGLSLATGLMGFAAGTEITAAREFVRQNHRCENLEKEVGQGNDGLKRDSEEFRRLSAKCVKECTEATARCEQTTANCEASAAALDLEIKKLQSEIAECGDLIKYLSGAVEVNKACCDANNEYATKLEADLAACKK